MSEAPHLILLDDKAQATEILTQFLGKELERVVMVQTQELAWPYDFNGAHIFDTACCWGFTDGSWINCAWIADADQEGNPAFTLWEGPLLETYKSTASQLRDVSAAPDWAIYIGQTLEGLEHEVYQRLGAAPVLYALHFNMLGRTVSFHPVEKPNPGQFPSLRTLSYAPEWGLIDFDRRILKV